ncbi:MAG: tetratricopeptide repeat protein [Beijerinckiaceae bacterium]
MPNLRLMQDMIRTSFFAAAISVAGLGMAGVVAAQDIPNPPRRDGADIPGLRELQRDLRQRLEPRAGEERRGGRPIEPQKDAGKDQGKDSPKGAGAAPGGDLARASLDSLFERLAKAGSEAEGKRIADLIERRLSRSGSDTADLLMTRATDAIDEKNRDLPQAIELLDRIIALEPKWAEAYYRRATALFLIGDLDKAMNDMRAALGLEPRHFGALAGAGQMLMAEGDRKRALQMIRKALDIYPQQPSLKEMEERLAPQVDGRDI